MQINKFLSWLLVFLWMGVIFKLSSQAAEESSTLSEGITKVIVETVKKVAPQSEISVDDLNHMVRKSAHFFSYLLLGLLTVNALYQSGYTGMAGVVLGLSICVLYALSDEIHQIFVPGRGGQMRDVLIDSTGACVGIGIYILAGRMIRKFKTRRA